MEPSTETDSPAVEARTKRPKARAATDEAAAKRKVKSRAKAKAQRKARRANR